MILIAKKLITHEISVFKLPPNRPSVQVIELAVQQNMKKNLSKWLSRNHVGMSTDISDKIFFLNGAGYMSPVSGPARLY